MKVGMVLDQPFPPDARVEREAMTLVQAGYEVHLLCVLRDPVPQPVPVVSPARQAATEASHSVQHQDTNPATLADAASLADAFAEPSDSSTSEPHAATSGGDTTQWYQEPREEILHGIHIHRVNPKEVTVRLPFFDLPSRFPYEGLYKNLSRSVWNIDTVWHTLIRRFVERLSLDILHVHDLRLVSTGLAVAHRAGIPLVADLHENYPALIRLLKGRTNPADGERHWRKWDRIERQCAWQADRIITVVDEARDRLINAGVRPDKISVVPNTVDMAKFLNTPVRPDVLRRYKSTFLLTYVGHINGRHRGLQTLIDAMALLRDEIPQLFLVAAGQVQEHYFAELINQIGQLGLSNRVEFTGWMDETEFVSFIQAADLCVCPHLASDHTHTTFPNKVYLYHLFGKPVLASNCKPLQRYITESAGGLSYEAGNADAMAQALRTLYKNPALRRTMGEAGRQSVLTKHNWQAIQPRFVQLYDDLARQRAAALREGATLSLF
jgi:glycosyltransferase involved in cell wall biosynthesis